MIPYTNQGECCNPLKRKRNSDEGPLLKRFLAATVESRKFKVHNMEEINAGKKECPVSSIVNSRKSYTVQIWSSPTCSYPYFQKNCQRVFCKLILFLLNCVLRINESSELLKNWYFSEDDVRFWFYNNPINAIYQKYVEKVEKSSCKKRNLQEILLNHSIYNQPQKVKHYT